MYQLDLFQNFRDTIKLNSLSLGGRGVTSPKSFTGCTSFFYVYLNILIMTHLMPSSYLAANLMSVNTRGGLYQQVQKLWSKPGSVDLGQT